MYEIFWQCGESHRIFASSNNETIIFNNLTKRVSSKPNSKNYIIIMNSYVKKTTIKEMHENLTWFDFRDLDNCESMTDNELQLSDVTIYYDKEEDIVTVVFDGGGHVFEPFHYEKGSEFDREQLEDMFLLK